MPLVLAAIDLKLSTSNRETERRQKRLDSLSRIVRHSESLYDVTDFVAIGTNQILQLAYSITRKVFLAPVVQPRIDARKAYSGPQIQPLHKRGSRVRVKGWFDAFVSCPRAYLLISTSVDYSLAVGRLPCEDSIPPLVRQLCPSSGILRLPWAIDQTANNKVIVETDISAKGSLLSSESNPPKRRKTPFMNSNFQNHYFHYEDEETIRSEHGGAHRDKPRLARVGREPGKALRSKRQQDSASSKSHINLDFLEFRDELGLPVVGSSHQTPVSDTAHHSCTQSRASSYCDWQHDYLTDNQGLFDDQQVAENIEIALLGSSFNTSPSFCLC